MWVNNESAQVSVSPTGYQHLAQPDVLKPAALPLGIEQVLYWCLEVSADGILHISQAARRRKVFSNTNSFEEYRSQMLIPSSFRPKALVAAVVLAGVLLAPLASHGCDARGTRAEDDAAATVAVAVTKGDIPKNGGET